VGLKVVGIIVTLVGIDGVVNKEGNVRLVRLQEGFEMGLGE